MPLSPRSAPAATLAALTLALLVVVAATGTGHTDAPTVPPATPEALAFFETKIRPVFAANCYGCHGKDAQVAGLRMDSRAALVKGGESGTALVPGDVQNSLLVRVVRHVGAIKMPQGGKLKDSEIADIETWVKMGAPWTPPKAGGQTPSAVAPKPLWSLQPVTNPALPPVKNTAWATAPLDRFVLAKMEAKGLTPSAPASRRVWLRRVTFDLTGLPPTIGDTAAFLADTKPGAFERVVDRLLASPRYGERMARAWLDVARYSDTKGYTAGTEDRNYLNAFTYRDWVIAAFNRDLPYTDFLVAQLAADRLPNGGKADLAALGFLTVGRRFLGSEPDIMDDRIDTTMRGLQGLTVACARCHDHKFDPVPTQDYYSLYAVFAATKETAPVIAGTTPPRVAMALEDKPDPGDGHVFKRGNPGNLGEVAPRRFLKALSPANAPRPVWTGSGRLELAHAIASPANPLTARVFVNRMWRSHFGQGLVRTASDFGHQGEPPTHPELLDYLATRFVADGWSVKKLHRRIVLSATYRQGSVAAPGAGTLDPDNRLLSRFPRRRLDMEQVRDALFWASGKLDTRMVGGVSADLWTPPFTPRRALYGKIDRQNLPQTFRTWDFASPDSTNAGRFVTTVPQQSLFFLNAPLVVEQARAIAALPEIAGAPDDAARVRALYRRVLTRQPDADELALGVRYLHGAPLASLPPSVWTYGTGAWSGAGSVTGFAPLPVFTGDSYRASGTYPDPSALGYAALTAEGGHPGNSDAQAVVRRFTAPRNMTVIVNGNLGHKHAEGDGVQATLIAPHGVTIAWAAHNTVVQTASPKIALKRGETLDFVVAPGAQGAAFDSFFWQIVVGDTGGSGETWDAKQGFAAPVPPPVSRREQYAQALLMTDEFLFVD